MEDAQMRKYVLAPDSFKGTLSAVSFCEIGEAVIRRCDPHSRIVCLPVADGGEGTVDCFVRALGARRVVCTVPGPWQEPVSAAYAVSGDTAFVEMAQAAGLPLAAPRLNPAATTTLGVGMLLRDAVARGCRHLVIGLGGSCTNDGGAGAAAALGTKFYNAKGETFLPVGGTLGEIARYDSKETRQLLRGCTVTAMCDIDNVLCGPQGAAAVFGPQKGAGPEMVAELDRNLRHLGQLIRRQTGLDAAQLPGAGAAGGFGAGVSAFLCGTLRSGIETVLDCVRFDQAAAGADMVFTGEGRFDGQSFRGKTVMGVARRAARLGVPVTVLAGDVGEGAEQAYSLGVTALFCINRRAEPLEAACRRTAENLQETMDAVMRLLMCRRP